MVTVDKANDAIEVARRVIDVVYSKVGQNIVEANDHPRDGPPEAEETNRAYDNGFKAAREASSVSVEDLDLVAVVKAVFPGESA